MITYDLKYSYHNHFLTNFNPCKKLHSCSKNWFLVMTVFFSEFIQTDGRKIFNIDSCQIYLSRPRARIQKRGPKSSGRPLCKHSNSNNRQHNHTTTSLKTTTFERHITTYKTWLKHKTKTEKKKETKPKRRRSVRVRLPAVGDELEGPRA